MKEIHIQKDRATTRMGHLPIEGGGLNAGYDTVDAVANICTTAGNLGMKYGKDFIWAYAGYEEAGDELVLDLALGEVKTPAKTRATRRSPNAQVGESSRSAC